MLVSNHPQLAGGSHLPDITVITPVWEGGRVVFFVASRGHHAGGREGGRAVVACCIHTQAPCCFAVIVFHSSMPSRTSHPGVTLAGS